MKVCPKCAQSFAEGFRYCPKDAAELVRYDLRARVQAGDEMHLLLPTASLLTRLQIELSTAWQELRRDPRNFSRSLLRGEGSSGRRKRLLQAGLASAVIAYATIFMALVLVQVFKSPATNSVDAALMREPAPHYSLVPVFKAEPVKPSSRAGQGRLGGSLPQAQRPQGGGGGGTKTPASRGVEPQALPDQQIFQPRPELPKIINPTLIVAPNVIGDPKAFLQMKGNVGLAKGQLDVPSPGDGLGRGIGPGTGPGYGPGSDGNRGGGKNKDGGGPTTGPGDDDVWRASAMLKPTILYKERASYTEDARQQRIQGTVVLSVIFSADGQLRDIRTVRGLPHGLTESAIAAARRIRFNPAVRNGQPVSVRSVLEFNFTLY
jgi:TonB family protein